MARPGAGEGVAVVVPIQAGGFGRLDKCCVTLVVEEAVWRTVAGVVVGHGIVILVEAQVVHVHAEVHVEPAVAIVVRNRGMVNGFAAGAQIGMRRV